MQKDKIVKELFVSLAGEGPYTGFLSIFVRLFGCNLAKIGDCGKVYCDTKYSFEEEPMYTIADTIDFIKSHNTYNHIVITGGCPLIHQDEIMQIINSFTHEELLTKTITIETNCTIIPTKSLIKVMSYYKGLWSVSPKTINGGYMHFLNKIQFFNFLPNVQFKFVIASPIPDEINKILSLFDSEHITKPYVIVQPNGMVEDYNKACRELADYVISNNLTNLRVLPQFHKICWGNQRNK